MFRFRIWPSWPKYFNLNFNRSLFSRNSVSTIAKQMGEEKNIDHALIKKESFDKTVKVPYLDVHVKNIEKVLARLRKYFFTAPHIKPVQPSEDPQRKIIFFDPTRVSSLSDEDWRIMKLYLPTMKDKTDFLYKEMKLTYDNIDASEALKLLLPEGVNDISSFSLIGHILHINLRDKHEPYKKIIGQVLLEKTQRVKMVINKGTPIDNTFRNFEIEILAQDPEMAEHPNPTIVTIKESGCVFTFDFAKVYWNPRLQTEHDKIIRKLQKCRDVLYDVMCGVGPFAIPVSKSRKCRVLANDLNPDCVHWIKKNRELNKIDSDLLAVHNLDGRDFIRTVLKDDLIKTWRLSHENGRPDVEVHVTMNLPAIAIQFLDAFSGLFADQDLCMLEKDHNIIRPTLHVYLFLKGKELISQPEKSILDMVQQHLGAKPTSSDIEEIVFVRNVAIDKDMYRISFKPSLDVLFSRKSNHIAEEEPQIKKMKTSVDSD